MIFLLFVDAENATGYVAGYMMGLFAAALHYLQAAYFSKLGNARFFSLYGQLSLVRIAVILLLFIGFILSEKIDQFSFTVSFLISYIYHSVINIFLLNKRTNNRPG